MLAPSLFAFRSTASRRTFLVLALALCVSAAYAETPADETSSEAGSQAQVEVPNSATISWDSDRQRYQAPAPEQAARLAELMRQWIDAKLAEKGSPSPRDAEVETLPNGFKKARLPLGLLNTARVHVGEDGELHPGCSEAADAPRAPAQAVVGEKERR